MTKHRYAVYATDVATGRELLVGEGDSPAPYEILIERNPRLHDTRVVDREADAQTPSADLLGQIVSGKLPVTVSLTVDGAVRHYRLSGVSLAETGLRINLDET